MNTETVDAIARTFMFVSTCAVIAYVIYAITRNTTIYITRNNESADDSDTDVDTEDELETEIYDKVRFVQHTHIVVNVRDIQLLNNVYVPVGRVIGFTVARELMHVVEEPDGSLFLVVYPDRAKHELTVRKYSIVDGEEAHRIATFIGTGMNAPTRWRWTNEFELETEKPTDTPKQNDVDPMTELPVDAEPSNG